MFFFLRFSTIYTEDGRERIKYVQIISVSVTYVHLGAPRCTPVPVSSAVVCFLCTPVPVLPLDGSSKKAFSRDRIHVHTLTHLHLHLHLHLHTRTHVLSVIYEEKNEGGGEGTQTQKKMRARRGEGRVAQVRLRLRCVRRH